MFFRDGQFILYRRPVLIGYSIVKGFLPIWFENKVSTSLISSLTVFSNGFQQDLQFVCKVTRSQNLQTLNYIDKGIVQSSLQTFVQDTLLLHRPSTKCRNQYITFVNTNTQSFTVLPKQTHPPFQTVDSPSVTLLQINVML